MLPACSPAQAPTHLGGEGRGLPVVVQHLVTAQAVMVNDVPFDCPEEVGRFIFYQPGLARRNLSQYPASEAHVSKGGAGPG